jgi:hypothetical protein
MIYEKCRDILLREYEFFQEAGVLQEKIRTAVEDRQWPDFEHYINAMNEIENQLAALDNEREQLFCVFEALIRKNTSARVMDSKGRFYAMASLLPENQRNELTSIYRNLKMEALKLRMANEAFMSYLTSVKSTIKEFFDLAFPDRAGKMYTPQGTHFSHDMRSMVLNHSF